MTELLKTLLKAGVVTQAQVERAEKQDFGCSTVGKLLVLGYGSEDDVYKIIKNNLKLKVVDTNELDNIDAETLSSIPLDIIKKNHILPFYADNTKIHIATCDPTQDSCFTELNFFTSKKIVPFGIMASDLMKTLNKYYDIKAPQEFKYGQEQVEVKNEKKPPLPIIKKMSEKDKIICSVLNELKGLSERNAIFFVRNDLLVAIEGYDDYSISLEQDGFFKDIYNSKKRFFGIPSDTLLNEDFFARFVKKLPAIICAVPVLIDDEVIAIIYAEEVNNPLLIEELAENMAEAFNKLITKQ